MRNFLCILAISAVASIGATAPVWAQKDVDTSPMAPVGAADATGAASVGTAAPGDARVLRFSSYRQGQQVANVSAGFTAIHTADVILNCPGPGTCTFEAEQNVQVGFSTAAGNRFAFCTTVDGVFVTRPRCPFLGHIPTDRWQGFAFTQLQTGLAPGNHAVKTFLFTDGAAQRALYLLAYRIYKP